MEHSPVCWTALFAGCLLPCYCTGNLEGRDKDGDPRQKSSLMPVLRACHSKRGVGGRSCGTWGFGRRRLSGPIPDPQNQNPPLQKISGNSHVPGVCGQEAASGEAADEEKLALILYIDRGKW